ncbi:MAG: amino acid ABC transporter permease [Alphaproteobacteria bacterium]|nr:amino acid ABC transporter permease [Alphaproteobacteria bacterium]
MDFSVIPLNLPYMLHGLGVTFLLAIVSMVASILTGTIFAMMRVSKIAAIRVPAAMFIDVMRTIPLIMVMFWFFFLIPLLTGQPVSAMVAAMVALIVFNTSYMAEVIRAGLQSVHRTQFEAAYSSGLRYLQTMLYIVLPQAFRNMLPAIINRLVALVMGTSLAYIIGVTEFFRAANNVNNRVYQSYVIYGFVAVVYFLCCYSLSLLGRHLERQLDPSAQAATKSLLSRGTGSA